MPALGPRLRTGTRAAAVAADLAREIAHGTWRPGERLPSVRALCRRFDASLTTVAAAYRALVGDGLVEARPQSGHFVRSGPRAPEPRPTRPRAVPTTVSVGELAMMVMRDGRDPGLVQLGAAMPDARLLPLERIGRIMAGALRRHGDAVGAYDPPPGWPELRVQVARRIALGGAVVGPDEIVTTCGGQEALVLALRATCSPGDTVAIESPLYYGILQAIESLGLRVVEVPTHPRDGIVLEALREALDEHRIGAVVVIPSYSNPLGSRMPDAAKRELVELLAARDIPLIEDDLYGDLGHDGDRPVLAKSFDRRGQVLLCSSFSKTVAPGLRVGFIAAGRHHDRVAHLKLTSTIATPTLPQAAVAELLASGEYDRHLRRVRPVYARQVAAMAQAVAERFPDGTRVCRPAGGFVLWIELPQTIDALRLYEAALGAGITIAPGQLFSAKRRYRHCLRLNAAWWDERVAQAVATLGTLAGRMLRQARSA